MVGSQWFILETLGLILCLTTGDIIYSRLLGIDMIVINSDSVARELLNKRSAIYSDRPVIHTTELYVLLVIVIFSDIDRLARQVWTVFQYWTPSVWRNSATTPEDFPSSLEGRCLPLIPRDVLSSSE